MKCSQCGFDLLEDAEFCSNCGLKVSKDNQQVENSLPKTNNTQNTTTYSNNSNTTYNNSENTNNTNYNNRANQYYRRNIIPQQNYLDLVLSENEKVVKEYHCSRSYSPSSDGYLIVTNKRILFHGIGKKSTLNEEVQISSISGLVAYIGRNFNLFFLINGILLILLGFFILDKNVFVGFIFLIIAAFILYNVFKKTFFLCIYSSATTGMPINVGEGPSSSIVGNKALVSFTAEPTNETVRMISELGALVSDLQTLGDDAIEKWAN
ncbi:MAG: zinc ribbon domain-containing protein [Erysipelotrichaceae bacterium]|nr:zinc ribbon domain-containing protein [Erysipelotrichaceae bacterium]